MATKAPKRVYRTYGPLIAGIGGLLGLTYSWNHYRRGNGLKTPGVGNIEKAYAGGGATRTHTPAYGGTKRGDPYDNEPQDGGASLRRFEAAQGLGERQRPVQPTRVGAKFNEMKYDTKDQK